MDPSRYYHTLRYLRPVQIYGRVWHWLNPTKPDICATPALRQGAGRWVPAATRIPSMLDGKTFRFLNHVGHVRTAADWNDPAQEKLWLYNLHYFDDLNAAGAGDRLAWHRALIARWVAENPPGLGNGWEPYPTSLRMVNWIKWALAGNALGPDWAHSLAIQARWLRRHIEWHLLGNHLFANAKALVFAGLFFEGDEAAAWLAQGLKILRREVPMQVLADGGHFELSPMYHAIILEDVLDLINAAGARPDQVPEAVVSQWREAASRMLPWLQGMTHPDGRIAFFNDAAFGIAPNYATLADYAHRLGIASATGGTGAAARHFADSGYVRLEQGSAVALLDVAGIGPDYLPGHAHADTLSFELSLFGQRVVVNSGTSRYGLGPERLRQRGTAAHSTVEVDGADSSEVWGGFRVARRARPFGLTVQQGDGALTVTCAHDGYRRLPGRPIHRRRWRLDPHGLQIGDSIEGGFRTAVARYYLHPDVTVTGEGKGGQLVLPDGRRVRWSVEGGTARVVPATWHPEFGVSVPSRLIEILLDGREARFEFSWD
jgi:uncharacterized heparinase superfamily protein